MKTTSMAASYGTMAALAGFFLCSSYDAGAVLPSITTRAENTELALLGALEVEDPTGVDKGAEPGPATGGVEVSKPRIKSGVSIESADSESGGDAWERKDVAWLGIATEESPDALSSQLGLHSGEGLLVIFVATNSPAASAGIKKNDLLIEFNNQRLVLPAQLRKLVQTRAEGEKVELTLFRNGQKQNVSTTLGKTRITLGMNTDATAPLAELATLHSALNEMANGNVREQVRKAVEESIRQATNAYRNYGGNAKTLEELARNGIEVDKDATVTIKSRDSNTRTVVKTDETGTYVIVANPQKRLLAHDKSGKLLFDGDIETTDQQSKVPSTVWKRVKPMLDQVKPKSDSDQGEKPPKKTSTRPVGGTNNFQRSQRIADVRTLLAMLRFVLDSDTNGQAVACTNGLKARISHT